RGRGAAAGRRGRDHHGGDRGRRRGGRETGGARPGAVPRRRGGGAGRGLFRRLRRRRTPAPGADPGRFRGGFPGRGGRPMTRIIAGVARGRKLVVPKGEDTRPTSDRARGAIFSSWDARFGIEGTTVLDLFAGS